MRAPSGDQPSRVEKIGSPERVPHRLLEALRVPDEQSLHAARVAQVGDALAVLAPQRVGLAHARRRGQIAHRAVLHRHAEHIAACGHQHALAGGRERRRADHLARVLPLRPGLQGLHGEVHGDELRTAAAEVERLELAADLIDHRVAVCAGTAHVPGRFVSQLPHGVALGLVQKQVRGALVAVGDEHDVVADPQRIAVGGVFVRNFLECPGARIDDPEGRRIAAAVLPPPARSGVCHDVRTIGQALAVGRPGALDRDRLHDLLLIAALERHFVELTRSAVGDLAVGHEQHALAVDAPPRHDVRRRMPGEPARLTAFDGHHIDVRVVVIVGGKRDPFAVRRKVRRVFGRRMGGDLHRVAAVAVAHPDVPAIDEGEMILRDCGLAQKAGGRVFRCMQHDTSTEERDHDGVHPVFTKAHVQPVT